MLSLENKLKTTEESMHHWFKTELPRLVTGLPVTEDILSYIDFNNNIENLNPNMNAIFPTYNSYNSSLDSLNKEAIAVGVHEPNHISNKLLSSLGMDRTYALSQALCASQATQAIQLMRISGLTEMNSILKERNINLEGVLIRWKDQIIHAEIHHNKQSGSEAMLSIEESFKNMKVNAYTSSSSSSHESSGMIGAAYGSDHVIQQIYTYVENESKLTLRVHELTKRVIELEEECIELKAKSEQASTRALEMKTLVEVVMADEQVLKTKATKQLTKIRMDLENQHADELRQVRQGYEKDKNMLVNELQSVAAAVEEAKLSSIETKTWEQLVQKDQNQQNLIEREFDALEYGILPTSNDNYQYKYNITPPFKADKMKQKNSKGINKHRKSKHRIDSHNNSSIEDSSMQSSSQSQDNDSPNNNHNSDSGSSSSSSDNSDNDDPKQKKSKKNINTSKKDNVTDIDKLQKELEHSRDQFNNYLQQLQQRGPSTFNNNNNYETTMNNNMNQEHHVLANQLKLISDGIEALQKISISSYSNPPTTAAIKKHYTNNKPNKPTTTTITTPSTLNTSTTTTTTGASVQQGLVEVQIENLERVLELERRKHEETKFEVTIYICNNNYDCNI